MRTTAVVFLFLLSLGGCDDEAVCLPECIIEEIGNLGEHHCSDSANISQYIFQGSTVYLIDPGNCGDDQSYDVVDSNCEVIGRLGGFVGNENINGVAFYENAKLIAIVWQK